MQGVRVDDYMPCYLTAQSGDPKKEELAFAQSYFAVQTCRAEMMYLANKVLSLKTDHLQKI